MQVFIQIGLAALGTLLGVVGFIIAFLLKSNFAALKEIWGATMTRHDECLRHLEKEQGQLRGDFTAWQIQTSTIQAQGASDNQRLELKIDLQHRQNSDKIDRLETKMDRLLERGSGSGNPVLG